MGYITVARFHGGLNLNGAGMFGGHECKDQPFSPVAWIGLGKFGELESCLLFNLNGENNKH